MRDGLPGDAPDASAVLSGAVGDPAWTRVTRLARALTGAAVALLTTRVDDVLLVVGADGGDTEAGTTRPLPDAPCRLVLSSGGTVRLPDLRLDPRTRDGRTTADTGMVAYLGVPLLTSAGTTAGSLCVMDDRPRQWTPEQTEALLDLARLLGDRLDLQEEREHRDELVRLHADVVDGSLSGLVVMDERGYVLDVNPAVTTMLGWRREDLLGRTVAETLVPDAYRALHVAGVDRVRDGGPHVAVGQRLELLAMARDGEAVPIELSVTRSESAAGTRYSGSLRDLRTQVRMRAGMDSLLSSATVAVLEVDLDGVVRRTEGHGLLGGHDLVGTALDEVLGQTVSDRLLVPVDGAPVRFDLAAFDRAWRATAIPLRPTDGAATGWVVSLVDITDVRDARTQLEQAYRTDALTGLLSRVGLEQDVASLVAGAPDRTLQVTTLRLHGLGETNESFGHEVGDELLRVSAARLRSLLPGGDEVVARVDAGQFSLVGYAGSGLTTAWAGSAARVLARPVRVRAVSVVPRVSVGTATCDVAELGDAGSGDTGGAVVTELLRRAEVAVHAARRAGLTVREYHRSDDVAARRLVLASNLRDALSTPPDGRSALDLGGRLRLHYQPVVALPGSRVVSVEALLRWEDDILGPLAPVEVVDVAEVAGLAVPLGVHVMALALHDAASWWAEGHHVPVMVNLSALQVCETSLVGTVVDLLARNGLPGEALVVEVTETAVLRDAVLAAAVLQRVRALGRRGVPRRLRQRLVQPRADGRAPAGRHQARPLLRGPQRDPDRPGRGPLRGGAGPLARRPARRGGRGDRRRGGRGHRGRRRPRPGLPVLAPGGPRAAARRRPAPRRGDRARPRARARRLGRGPGGPAHPVPGARRPAAGPLRSGRPRGGDAQRPPAGPSTRSSTSRSHASADAPSCGARWCRAATYRSGRTTSRPPSSVSRRSAHSP